MRGSRGLTRAAVVAGAALAFTVVEVTAGGMRAQHAYDLEREQAQAAARATQVAYIPVDPARPGAATEGSDELPAQIATGDVPFEMWISNLTERPGRITARWLGYVLPCSTVDLPVGDPTHVYCTIPAGTHPGTLTLTVEVPGTRTLVRDWVHTRGDAAAPAA